MSAWFLKKEDGHVYGPVEQNHLAAWAGDGRVSPGDEISEDRERWQPAASLPELNMEWKVEIEDGTLYGPVHLASVKDLFDEGSTDLISRVVHEVTGEEYSVAQLLIAYLDDKLTKQQAAAQPPEDDTPEKDTPEKDTPEPSPEPEPAPDHDLELEKKNTELLSARARIGELEKQLKQAANKKRHARRDPSGAPRHGSREPEALLNSYQDLKKQFDRLAAQLNEKTKAEENTQALFKELKAYTEERLTKLESLNKRYEGRAENAETQLQKLEETHRDLLRSYREINDRHIQLLQQIKKPQEDNDDQADPEETDSAPAPRLRMTRND